MSQIGFFVTSISTNVTAVRSDALKINDMFSLMQFKAFTKTEITLFDTLGWALDLFWTTPISFWFYTCHDIL